MDGKNELEKLKEEMRQIPFGMSNFQIESMAGEHDETPARRRRHLLLQLDQKLNALQYNRFVRDRKELDLQEIEEKMSKIEKDDGKQSIAYRRLEIDWNEAKWTLDNQVKLIEDAMIECTKLKELIDAIPAVTRQEFEQQERQYWQKRLLSDANHQMKFLGTINVDTAQTLEKVGVSIEKDSKGQLIFKGIEADVLKQLPFMKQEG